VRRVDGSVPVKGMVVMADTHIPDRARTIDNIIKHRIEREAGEYGIVVHAGDLTSGEVFDWLESISSELYVVSGNMDYLPLQDTAVFEIMGVKVGVIHGHQVYPRGNVSQLANIARSMGVRILVSGHTHAPFMKKLGDVILVNPGSVTGVWGGGGGSMKPSYSIIMLAGKDVQVNTCTLEGVRVECVTRAYQL